MHCVKTLKLLIFFGLVSIGLPAMACNIDSDIEDLAMAETDFEREEILYSISSSLLFCTPVDYAKAMKATFEYTELGPFFMTSFLFQYQQYYPNSYQIGSEWNRKEFDKLKETKLDQYIYRVGSATGVYLGRYNGKSLFATNRHVIEGENCEDVVISSTSGVEVKCDEIINPMSELDYAFILVDESVELTALNIEKEMVASQTSFMTGGRGYYNNEGQLFKEESSELCMKFTEDRLGETMGCDSSPGDSGSPVFLKKSLKLYGLANSTGTSILDFSNSEVSQMSSDSKFEKLISLQSSHLVPFYRILKDSNNISNAKAIDILNCINEEGCLN
jgi:hypothetical protein